MHSPNGSPAVALLVLGAVDVRTTTSEAVSSLLNQPKPLAMLVYLALAPKGRARRRDELLAMFWPESGAGSARNALSQTLFRLRSALGESALVGNEQDVRLDEERVRCDAVELRTASAAGHDRRVLELYRGDLLAAFHVRGVAPEFEMWLARERDELRALAARSAWRMSDADAAANNPAGAAHWARIGVSLAPADEDAARRLMLLLDTVGDRTGALRAYDDYATTLATFDLQPSNEMSALAAAVRARATPDADRPVLGNISLGNALNGQPPRKRTRYLVGATVALAVVSVALGWVIVRGRADKGAIVAVGTIALESAGDSVLPVTLLLSTSLSRIAGLTVITEDRVGEVRAQMVRAGVKPADVRRAALHAGADRVIEGVFSQRDGKLRLDLRQVDRNAHARGGHVVEGRSLYDVVDLATEQIAADLGLKAPAGRMDATNASLVAYRLYELGLRAMQANDGKTASRFFHAALAEDSTFAMAAYNASRVTEGDEHFDLIRRARRLSASSPEHERLLIAAHAAYVLHEMNAIAVAETLAIRYPHDPVAAKTYGDGLMMGGRFVDAAAAYRRAANLDSLSMYSPMLMCQACDGFGGVIVAYMFADSPAAVERETRALVARFPTSPHAWNLLGNALRRLEKFDESDRAYARAPGTGAEDRLGNAGLSDIGIRTQHFRDIDVSWEAETKSPDIDTRMGAYWGAFISLNTQGRLREAYAAGRMHAKLTAQNGHPYPILEGIGLMGLGRFQEAARIFESEERRSAAAAGPLDARVRAWNLTHAAAAYAAAGDTSRLALLEDSVRGLGARSPYARDQRLHYYIRGLRLEARGDYRAARAALDKSVYSLHEGYVRIPLEIARVNLALGDPQRAITALKPALLGPLSASGLYASRTDLMELLGNAYERAQQRDSAIAVYTRVLKSWELADPELQPRVRSVRSRLAALAHPKD